MGVRVGAGEEGGPWEVPPTGSPAALSRPWGPRTLGSKHTCPAGTQNYKRSGQETEDQAKAQTVAGTGPDPGRWVPVPLTAPCPTNHNRHQT